MISIYRRQPRLTGGETTWLLQMTLRALRFFRNPQNLKERQIKRTSNLTISQAFFKEIVPIGELHEIQLQY